MGQAAGTGLSAGEPECIGETRRLRFSLAGAADNADVNRMLRSTPVPGWITLSYEREPDYFRAAATEGDVHETLLGRDRRSGELVVMASFSIQDAWIDGEHARVGYLGQLRLTASHQSRPWPVLEGYRFIRRMMERREDVHHVLTSIVSTNTKAKRLLTSGSRNLPVYEPIEGFWTLAYPCRRRSAHRGGLEISPGSRADRVAIARFLEKQASRFQFAPSWRTDRLWDTARCPALGPGDFLLARRGISLVGCVALWDQGSFKQHVVRGYAPWVSRLPSAGSPLRQVALSHLAIEDDDPRVLETLLGEALDKAKARGFQVGVTGLGDRHPLLQPARRLARHMAYRSNIYRVHWGEPGSHAGLDSRPLHLEAAIL
jgi:hypothetical protein